MQETLPEENHKGTAVSVPSNAESASSTTMGDTGSEKTDTTSASKITRKGNFKDAVIDFIGGSLGGVASVYVGQPLDTVKVKMQAFPQLYTGMVDCFKRTLAQEGISRGLYAGTIPAVAANVAENSVLFAGYGACQKVIASFSATKRTEDLSILGNSFAGCLAAFFSSFTLCPTELVKCRLQALNEVNAAKRCAQLKNVNGTAANSEAATKLLKGKIGPFKLTKQILVQEGIPGLFRGLTSTIVREMPGYFFFFGGYEASRQMLAKEGQSKDDIGPLKTMLAGGIGGVTFWLVIFPADVIKSRIQVEGSKEPLMKVFLDIYKKEGLPALYNGLKPTLVRTVPATAALFLVYENTKKVLHSLFD
ncbi:mitochondrial ornithine transporter 1 [Ischnura elegans]|uniref:mitochondrial ornithine transporter 1 n=1 Tax=Ischnura elegans TaxID=197161 RepID=UPI001ED8BDA3|nr:mitochondrial ornithine transporter 1 [Ischnura elegans]